MASMIARTASVAGMAITLVATVGAAGVGATPDGRWPAELGLLSVEQSADDVLPDFVSDERVDPASTRLVLDGDDATHWAALSHGGDVCLITHLPGADVAGSACVEPDRFEESGVELFVSGAMDETSSEARLVPDGYPGAGTGWQAAAPGLLVREPADRGRLTTARDAAPDAVNPQRSADPGGELSVAWHTYFDGNLLAGQTMWSSRQFLSEARVLSSLGFNGHACTVIYESPSGQLASITCGGEFPVADVEEPMWALSACWWEKSPIGREGPLAMRCDWGV